MAESSICSSQSRRPGRKLLDTPSFVTTFCYISLLTNLTYILHIVVCSNILLNESIFRLVELLRIWVLM